MILWWASASAAPVSAPTDPVDALERCVEDAFAAADGFDGLPDPGPGPHDRVAVVVGVPCHEGEAIPSLAYSTRDAVQVARQLSEGGFAVIPLLTVVHREELLAALDRASRMVSPQGTLLVYFSGHGVLREEGGAVRRYLVMSDTALDALSTTAVDVRTLEWRLDQVEASQRVLVQDTCFAARTGGKSLGQPHAGEAKGLASIEPSLRLRDGDLRLYSSRFFEQALESPELRGSIYTVHLLDAFARSEADLDGDRCVGLIEAHRWATEQTRAQRDGFQVPQIEQRAGANLMLGCTPQPPTHAVIVARPGERDDELAVLGPDGEPVPDREPVLPGRYRVRLDHLEVDGDRLVPERLLDARTRLRAGEWLDVDAELARRAGFVAAGVDLRLNPAGEASSMAAGVSALVSARDRGQGRPMGGVAVRGWTGGGPVLVRAAEGVAWGGWAWTLGGRGPWMLAGGPAVGAGGLWWRQASAADVTQSIPGAGPLFEAGWRGWLSHGRFVLGGAVGARGLRQQEDRSPLPGSPLVTTLSLSPVTAVTLGVQL